MYSWMDNPTFPSPIGEGRPALAPDARVLRSLLGRYATGVCLVSMRTPEGKCEGMTINSFASVSLDPPLVLWSIAQHARSAEAFIAATHFNISVLGARHKELALHFAKPSLDKFERYAADFSLAGNGAPRLADAPAVYECVTYSRHREGDHTILIGRVEHFDGQAQEPLLFHGGQLGALGELAQAAQATPAFHTAQATQAARTT